MRCKKCGSEMLTKGMQAQSIQGFMCPMVNCRQHALVDGVMQTTHWYKLDIAKYLNAVGRFL